jgi:hypothetical protein
VVPHRKGADDTFQPANWAWRDDVEDRQGPHCCTFATRVEPTHPPPFRGSAEHDC